MDRTKRMAGDLQPRQKHYEAEMKFRILYLSEQKNTDPGEIATAFGISRNTLHNWRNAYDEKGMAGLEDAPRSGRRPFVSDADAKKCRDAAREEHGLVTRDRMRDKIREMHGVPYSDNAVWKILRRIGSTCKKADPVHARSALNAEIDSRCDENLPIIDARMRDVYALMSQDEARARLDSEMRHGYAERGRRVYATYHGRKQKITITGAIGTDGGSICRTYPKADSETFARFLGAVGARWEKVIMLVDAASYHVSKRTTEWPEANPGILLIRLPVGSPHMNPIENLWGRLKAFLRQFIYYETGKFRADALRFLRKYNFAADAILKKLGSRPEPDAEKCAGEARRQREIMRQNAAKK